MPDFIDHTGRSIHLASVPRRIISLVPSQTELLADLGLDEEVVGITKFCVHPESWFINKTRVGGTKQIKMDIIHQLNPDLVLANKEENVKEQIEELERHYPVWVSDVNNIDDACEMIYSVGYMTGKAVSAQRKISSIRDAFDALPKINARPRAAYLIWQHPYMTVGGDTFIHSMMEAAGFDNVFASRHRYPTVTIADIQATGADLLLLSSEPYPFRQKHIDELQPQLPQTKILLVDGEMFSWYGTRMQLAAEYFLKLKSQLTGIDKS
jgi:ABC-type Fe3+-hydroxamate transport system substrate-binding protein